MAKLTKRKIDATKPDRELRLWDDDPRGLGIRIKPTGSEFRFLTEKMEFLLDQGVDSENNRADLPARTGGGIATVKR